MTSTVLARPPKPLTYPLYVAFLWHMHQPYYKNALTGEYTLPWVRLHATRDYLHMAEVLQDYPKVHQTFNFVPCLVEQLLDYATGEAVDRYSAVALREELAGEDKAFMLANFFSTSWERVVRRYPRYWQLLQLRQQVNGDVELLSDRYWRDLAVWFHLAWFDAHWLREDPLLRRLVGQGRDFTRQDLLAIAEKQREMCGRIVPLYRLLAERGQIELSTSPFFHPALPLLVDNRSARRASPQIPLPATVFAHPEDAAEQIRQAIELHRKVFGIPPKGLWPPEGAVSHETVTLLARRHNLQWVASDEGVLARSLQTSLARDASGQLRDPRRLYQPYRVGEDGLAIFFRDQVLSDRIGFVYKRMDALQAAEDLVARLHHTHEALAGDGFPYLVSIILDGENCWEEYSNNGDDFLHHLYRLLSETPRLRTVTLSEYLSQFPPQASLEELATGSWIGGNLETWIGEREQNRAWDSLATVRQRLIAWQQEYPLADLAVLERAWQEIYVTEGSDWFWWYYSRNRTGSEPAFDAEFRLHLGNVYRIIGLPVPRWLSQPIAELAEARSRSVSSYISPRLAATETASLEWTGAGYVEAETSLGTMQPTAPLLKRLYYGYNPADLYLRCEADQNLDQYALALYIAVPRAQRANIHTRYAGTGPDFQLPDLSFHWEVMVHPGGLAQLNRAEGDGLWRTAKTVATVVRGRRAIELCLVLADLGLEMSDTVGIVLVAASDQLLADALPKSGHLSFTLNPMT